MNQLSSTIYDDVSISIPTVGFSGDTYWISITVKMLMTMLALPSWAYLSRGSPRTSVRARLLSI